MNLTNMRPALAFSVILPVYDQPETARMVLECSQEQNDAPNFEVIVCDDGSSPETFLACQEVIRNATVPTYWVWQQDHGIRMASGRFLFFLDGDMVPEQDLLAGHFRMHTRPGLLVLGSRSWSSLELASASNPEGAAAIWQLLRGTQVVDLDLLSREEDGRKRFRHILKRGGHWRLAMANNLSLERTEAVYVDEGFVGWGLEDAELGFRLLEKRGFELVYSQDLVCYHLQGTQDNPLRTGSHEAIVGMLRNLIYFSEKWPDLRVLKNHTLLHGVELDPATDRWSLVGDDIDPKRRPGVYDQAYDWLRRNGQFPSAATTVSENQSTAEVREPAP